MLNVRKPRQKSARWILVDFETNEHAEEFKKILEEKKYVSVKHQPILMMLSLINVMYDSLQISTLPVKVKKLNIKQHDPSKADNERHDKINSLARQTFQSTKLEKYSNKLLITNIPNTITMEELRELFPGHQKIDLKQTPNTRAYVTYSSAKEAMNMRIALKPVIAREKFRVIILLLNPSNDKKSNKSNNSNGRYFESSIE